jgi:hypothetical protein
VIYVTRLDGSQLVVNADLDTPPLGPAAAAVQAGHQPIALRLHEVR